MNSLYNFFGDYLRKKYNCRVLKLSINANLSCPNRDGTRGFSGCIFCSEDGSASPTSNFHSDITDQMEFAKKNFKRSNIKTRYIAYFQAYTNTYSTIKNLKQVYDSSISPDDVVGLMIGTRPDCINKDVLNLISQYKKDNFELWLEIGMQTKHEKSLEYLNRRHTHEETRKSIIMASDMGIQVCVHIIIGIPGESWNDVMETAEEIVSLPVSGVKFHHLHIIKGTALEKLNQKNKIKNLSLDEYKSIICDFIERLDKHILIHRLMADREEETLIAPLWGLHKGTVIKAIEDEFIKRGTYQGFLSKKENFY